MVKVHTIRRLIKYKKNFLIINMKRCSSCGNEIEEQSVFCSYCGKKQNSQSVLSLIGKYKWVIVFLCGIILLFKLCSNDVSSYAGTYRLVCYENQYRYYYITVSKDGRCIGGTHITGVEDEDLFLGYVKPLSKDAFKLSDARNTSWFIRRYRNGEQVGGSEAPLRNLVFDIRNNRVYFSENDYLNKDIANTEYCVIPLYIE